MNCDAFYFKVLEISSTIMFILEIYPKKIHYLIASIYIQPYMFENKI
jgi:hypothetical protein